MSWDKQINEDSNNSQQLWKKIKRLEGQVRSKDEFIVELQARYEDQIATLKQEVINLKISNSMLKKHRPKNKMEV